MDTPEPSPGLRPARGVPVEPLLSDLLARSPTLRRVVRAARAPQRLHHYTAAATLPAILRGEPFACRERGEATVEPGTPLPQMRATHLRFMNDRSELKLATALMSDELGRHAAARRGALARRLDAVRDTLAALSDEPWIWALSWSERGNQLSQWRAYAGGVGGFSVGVPVAHLLRMAAWQRFALVPCVYRGDLQRRIASEVVARHVETLAARGREASGDAAAVRRFAGDLLFVGATMKHPGFEEEREWRLILRASGDGGYMPSPSFHATPYGLASWVPFWLRAGPSDRLRGLQVVAGPTEDVEGILAGTRALLAQAQGVEGEVIASGIPLRR